MKKIYVLLCFLIVLAIIALINNKEKEQLVFTSTNEIRAIYISYIELSKYLDNKSEIEIKETIKKMIENIKKSNFNWIILHTRSFSDSIFPSIVYPSSYLITHEDKEEIKFDILEEFIKQSHDLDIELHVWINPYRIRNDTNIDNISIKNPCFKWLSTEHVKIIDKGIYYNPASSEVIKLIVNGIGEILEKYNIDGIHFDDYFYPSTAISFDSYFYQEYKKNGGQDNLEQFRLNNVNTLVKKVYEKIKSVDKNIKFSIAPDANIENNYKLNYADVLTWLKEPGYVDYIIPQVYYGFKNETKPFVRTINEWDSYIKNNSTKLIVALALYKTGTIDEYAKSGSKEWLEHNNIITREIQISRTMKYYKGFAIFRYDYFYNPENSITKEEINNLNEILEN